MVLASPLVSMPVYTVYIIAGAMISAFICVSIFIYRSRNQPNEDDLDCEEAARRFGPEALFPQLIVDTTARSVQPNNLKTKISQSMPWKSSVIDNLRPDFVSEYRGRLNFSISYETECSTLYVHVMQAVELPVRDITGSSDPYVKAFILEDPQRTERTRVHKRNLNPSFDQILCFPGNFQ
ncbi:hypothetical protein WR25_18608 [Diploscapter pachys]|uniref:C2 domain-containing protein n=1 Tax=Diploscapter pachys TaxID=2018661 RepID=A0A2A2LMW0_9BILA|nr:hypothetical protein WR25_18608 [Diploscapter pachys]